MNPTTPTITPESVARASGISESVLVANPEFLEAYRAHMAKEKSLHNRLCASRGDSEARKHLLNEAIELRRLYEEQLAPKRSELSRITSTTAHR